MIDNFVFSQSGGNESNYANVDEILKHATSNKVDAVWAGWGHASENPDLPNGLKQQNILFMGPPGSAMFTLGDKIASTILAQASFFLLFCLSLYNLIISIALPPQPAPSP